MGIILAGILAGVLVIGFMIWYGIRHDIKSYDVTLSVFLAIILVIFGFYIGITEPVSGYDEPQIASTTELISLRNETISEGTGRLFYVSVSGTNSYTYYVEVDSEYVSNSQKAYKSNTISDSNVTIVEGNNYTDAKLVTYVRHGTKSFWTFAVGAKKYEYVFYVPPGTIVRDISIG